MTLKELIKKRIEENVPDYDITKIERYEYLIEMIAVEYATEAVKNISSKPVLCGDSELLLAFAKYAMQDNYTPLALTNIVKTFLEERKQ